MVQRLSDLEEVTQASKWHDQAGSPSWSNLPCVLPPPLHCLGECGLIILFYYVFMDFRSTGLD